MKAGLKMQRKPHHADTGRSFTWVHLSDLHLEEDNYNQDIVTRTLLRDVHKLLEDDGLHPDCIFFTGDLVAKGKPEQFARAGSFLHDLTSVIRPSLKQHGISSCRATTTSIGPRSPHKQPGHYLRVYG